MILPILKNRRTHSESNRDSDNVVIARQRLQEVESLIASDEAAGKDAKLELQAALLEDMKSAPPSASRSISTGWGFAIIALIPLVSLGLYSYLGNPQFVTHSLDDTSMRGADISQHELDELLDQLDEKLAQEPENPAGWELAARTYMKLGNYEKAETAFRNLNALVPENPDFLVGWADATIMVTGSVYSPEARERIEKALALDSNNINALWIASLGAESTGEHGLALEYLNTLLPLVANDQNTAAQVRIMIERNLKMTDENYAEQESDPVNANGSGASGKVIPVVVSIATELKDLVADNAVVYVFAKASNGPAAPLAVSRHTISQLPLKIELTEEMAMLADLTIASFEEITVTARVSQSGNPIQQPGDFSSDPVFITPDTGKKPAALIINQVAE
jgi:cytochrome c-type biogenesis protein CcmH